MIYTKSCWTCAKPFTTNRERQMTCSHSYRAIKETRLRPKHFRMVAANQANAERRAVRLAEQMQALTPLQAFKAGYLRGYRTAAQKAARLDRRVA